MADAAERLWDFDAVVPGQRGADTVVTITGENIAGYAAAALCDAARYRNPAPDALAMPTMALSYAPLLREEIAAANGFTALEQSTTARRQTPFAKCEIRWRRPVCAGDIITASRQALEKYERRGSRFVTFRVAAVNGRGEAAAEYDYTCIFDYAGGQREIPHPHPHPKGEGIAGVVGEGFAGAAGEGIAGAASEGIAGDPAAAGIGVATGGAEAIVPAGSGMPQGGAVAVGPGRLLDFASAAPGTPLAELAVTESQAIINRRSTFRLAGRPNESNIHTDPEFARQNIFGGTVNSGPATMSYVDQMLQRSFPPEAFYRGGRLLMRAITPFRSGDTVVFQGEVTARHPAPPGAAAPGGVVECRVRGVNQRGELVCLADAALRVG